MIRILVVKLAKFGLVGGMSSTSSSWTLYYSNEGYPYYFNSLTNESVWADTTSRSEPTLTMASTDTSNDVQNEVSEDSESGESSSEDSDEDDDEVTEKLFLEYIQSSDGIAAMEAEQSKIAAKLQSKAIKKQKRINLRILRKQDIFKRRKDGEVVDSASSSEESSTSDSNDSDNSSVSSNDSDLQEALEPLIPPAPVIVGSLLSYFQSWRQGARDPSATEDDLTPLSARKRRIQIAAEAYSKSRSSWLGWVAESTLFFIRDTFVLFVGGVEHTLRSLITDPKSSSIQAVVSAPAMADEIDASDRVIRVGLDHQSVLDSNSVTSELYTSVLVGGSEQSENATGSAQSGKKLKWFRG